MEVTVVRHGRSALDALATVVADAKAGDPLAPVTILVPNNFVGVATRRALASGAHGPITGAGPGLAGVGFLTLYRLAELFGSARLAAEGRRPVSTPVIAAAVRRALRDSPGIFAPVAEHPTTEKRLVRAHRELSDVDRHGIEALRTSSRRAAEVVRIHEQVRSQLAPDWFSEQDLVESAIGELRSGPGPGSLGTVVFFLPEELSAPMARLLLAVADSHVLHLLPALTGFDDADAPVRRALALLQLELPVTGPLPLPSITALNVSDPDDEVRHVVREVMAAASEGTGFDRMAVVYATDRPYARLLHDHLAAASIPFNGATVGGLEASVTGRTLVRLLRLGERGMRREDVLGLVASLPFRWRNRPAPTRAWEQISREAGVSRGMDEWRLRLGRYRDDRLAEIADLGDDPDHEWRVERLRSTADRADDLLSFAEALYGDMVAGDRARTWSEKVGWCRRALRRYLGDLRDWPEDEMAAADRVDAILERLTGLDTLDDPCTPKVFSRTLALELEGGLGRQGRLGDGVLVGRAWTIAGLALDRVWVVGMAEGAYPSRPTDDSLLPDRERALVHGQLPLQRDRLGLDRRHLIAAAGSVAPTGSLHLLRPRGDLRATTERAPSRWLDDMRGDADPNDPGWDREIASFTRGLLHARFPATIQEHDLQTLVGAAPGSDDHPAFAEPGFSASVEATRSRMGPRFSRFDGNVPRDLVPSVGASPTSATALETWAGCPHAYFMRHVLGVYPLEPPETRVRLDALSRGNLVHSILERFVARAALGRPHRRWAGHDEALLLEIAEQAFRDVEARGLTGEPLYWRRDQVLIRRDLERFLREDDERRSERRLRPVAVELAFGMGAGQSVTLDLGEGSVLSLRGMIDLIDESDDGDLHVVDYKSGKSFGVSADDPHSNGTRLQLVLYAHAAQSVLDKPDAPVHSSYWFVSRRGGFKLAGYAVTEAVRERVMDAVGTIVANIANGVFPQRPDPRERVGAYVPCQYCDPDALGTRDARRRFETLASAPELADYVLLAEPDLLPARRLTESPR